MMARVYREAGVLKIGSSSKKIGPKDPAFSRCPHQVGDVVYIEHLEASSV
jgi:hypothetical protein